MDTKLTLTINKSVIENAKKYARSKERSLSDLIENYLKSLTANEVSDNDKLSPTLKALKGSFKMPDDFDYKKDLTERLTDKYF